MLSWKPICYCLAFNYEVSRRGPVPVRRYGEDMLLLGGSKSETFAPSPAYRLPFGWRTIPCQ
jgi:hypothetical protein